MAWKAVLLTPAHAAGAIAMIQLDGDVDAMLAALDIKPVKVGAVVVRSLARIDEGLVARWSEASCLLMPHGGVGVVRALLDAVQRAGIVVAPTARSVVGGTPGESMACEARSLFPEARSDIEACALFTLTRAASPLAVELLLQQHGLWESGQRSVDDGTERSDRSHGTYATDARCFVEAPSSPRDIALNRLIDPPLVVMLGRSNIGKSTLTNALAKRSVSVVADEPGTTRDHVGVMLDMAGLVIRFVDTPGLRDDPSAEEAAARDIALELARRADLVLLVGTVVQPPLVDWMTRGRGDDARQFVLTIALQSDVAVPTWNHDIAVSAKTGAGIGAFVGLVRETLVQSEFVEANAAWRFW